jgi:two-component system LytT family response regulator
MIRSVIIDDEADGRESLRLAITKYCPDMEIVAICESAQQGKDAIQELSPDLVFLDVQMPHTSGFELLQQLDVINFSVIFVTAFDKYAIKAIKFSALDYLLKPVDIVELQEAIKKYKESKSLPDAENQYRTMFRNINTKAGAFERLAVPTMNGLEFLKTEDIIFCEADGNYTLLHLKARQQLLVSKTLKDFETMLEDSGFCRVHHSYLINLTHILKYEKGEGGTVLLTDNHFIDVSRRKKDELLRRIHVV